MKEFTPYQESFELKELGFDEECLSRFFGEKLTIATTFGCKNSDEVPKEYDFRCTAPLYQQAFRWFREKHNWQASIEATKDQHRFDLGYNYWIWNSETGEEYHTMPTNCPSGDFEFKTYEEAELACLQRLIEIIKNKQSSDKSVLTGNVTIAHGVSNGGTSDSTVWRGGYVTDNYGSYYLDENMVKHYDKKNHNWFYATYRYKEEPKIKVNVKYLKEGKEFELRQKLKAFNLGSGHDGMEISKIDDDHFIFTLIPFVGAPVQTIYFERIKV